MCGRFTLNVTSNDMTDYLRNNYHIEEWEHIRLPRYNVAPGQNILTIIHDGSKFRAGPLKWGFIPFFSKSEETAYKMINAKSETVAEKPSFKSSLQNKRCIILADSFYEWQKNDSGKVPMRIRLKGDGIFSLAGLWSTFTRNDGSKLHTCTIITTSANQLVKPIHDRMPVILTKDAQKIWLNPNIKDSSLLTSILNQYDSQLMTHYPVSSYVNSVKNDDISCIKSI